jgi:hypothetical protein
MRNRRTLDKHINRSAPVRVIFLGVVDSDSESIKHLDNKYSVPVPVDTVRYFTASFLWF